MAKRRRMTVTQVMRFLNRSRSGLTAISDKLKPIPGAHSTAAREYWRDEVEAFKKTNPVDRNKQRGGSISRRNGFPHGSG